ncbi:MAG: maturase [Candidatus Accumulibacter sp.]|nr:maturase [Candidatus Accumulibacter conexus]
MVALGGVRERTRRTRGTTFAAVVAEPGETGLGWKTYSGIAEVLSPLRDLDECVRRKLRCHLWRQWGRAGYRELRKRGVSVRAAWHTGKSADGPWRVSQTPALSIVLPLRFFEKMGLPSLAPRQEFNSSNRRIRDPFVRWCGGCREAFSHLD